MIYPWFVHDILINHHPPGAAAAGSAGSPCLVGARRTARGQKRGSRAGGAGADGGGAAAELGTTGAGLMAKRHGWEVLRGWEHVKKTGEKLKSGWKVTMWCLFVGWCWFVCFGVDFQVACWVGMVYACGICRCECPWKVEAGEITRAARTEAGVTSPRNQMLEADASLPASWGCHHLQGPRWRWVDLPSLRARPSSKMPQVETDPDVPALRGLAVSPRNFGPRRCRKEDGARSVFLSGEVGPFWMLTVTGGKGARQSRQSIPSQKANYGQLHQLRRPSPRRDAPHALSEWRAVSPLFEDRGQCPGSTGRARLEILGVL